MNVFDRIIRAAPFDTKMNQATSAGIAFFIGLIVGVPSLWMAFDSVIRPIIQSVQASKWDQVTGSLHKLALKSDGGGSSTHLEIEYLYPYGNETFMGDRFSFNDIRRNFGVEMFAKRLNGLKVGEVCEVWVDPNNPHLAVIERSLDGSIIMKTLFCLPFLTVVLISFSWVAFGGRLKNRHIQLRSQAARRAECLGAKRVANMIRDHDPNRNKIIFVDGADRANGILYLAIGIFCNTMIGMFLSGAVMMMISSEVMGYVHALFMIPFIGVGIWLSLICYRGLFHSRLPDIVFIARGVTPIAEEMIIDIEWVYLGEYRRNDVSESFFGVRRNGHERQKGKKQPLSDGERRELISGNSQAFIGHDSLVLPAVEIKQNKWQTNKFEGSVDLLLEFCFRDGKSAQKKFLLGFTDD